MNYILSETYFYRIKNSAKKRNILFTLSKEYLQNLFDKQNFKCKISNLDIYFANKTIEKNIASLDRIDSSKPYVEGNVQWVHYKINLMKYNFSQDYFIKLCKLVSENYDK